MKKLIIAALVCLNIGLLTALVFTDTPEAKADGYFNQTDYLVVTGKVESNYEIVYIIDMASQQIGAIKADRGTHRMSPASAPRSLLTDMRD
jgi:hypothetical protein